MEIPCMLDKMIEYLHVGAIIKSTETDKKSIIVDFVFPEKNPVICTYYGNEDKSKDPTFESGDYRITIILDLTKWIVLTLGHDQYTLFNA